MSSFLLEFYTRQIFYNWEYALQYVEQLKNKSRVLTKTKVRIFFLEIVMNGSTLIWQFISSFISSGMITDVKLSVYIAIAERVELSSSKERH